MAVDTQQIMDEAEKLGQLVAQHPAVERYKQAQKAVKEPPLGQPPLKSVDRSLAAPARTIRLVPLRRPRDAG